MCVQVTLYYDTVIFVYIVVVLAYYISFISRRFEFVDKTIFSTCRHCFTATMAIPEQFEYRAKGPMKSFNFPAEFTLVQRNNEMTVVSSVPQFLITVS